ncbi:hypothetical protein F6B43_09990 [Microbacterium rhizomatis]|uniref:DUF4190 domain-containing protein n=1 Tax=Microbacterium rhizomatis TaxID=1631477 RepID=A0A5J5J1N1_9MICO|nr:hypothetical protein F6B43_09990 [Microbacterium rhizomatis]
MPAAEPGPPPRLRRDLSPAPRLDPPLLDSPSADVEAAAQTSVLPGEHRGGFSRLFTAPVGVAEQAHVDPDEQEEWETVEPPRLYRGIAGWALACSIVALITSLFVGWGFPVGVMGVIAGIVSLRRPVESRAVAIWAVVLGSVSVLYSAGWLVWAAIQLQAG